MMLSPRTRSRWIWTFAAVVAVVAAVLWVAVFAGPRRRTIVVDGVTREYLLYAPSSHTPGLKPLVLGFHGFDGTPENMAEESRLYELVDEEGFYLAFLYGDPSWRAFVPQNAEVSPDVAFFDRLCDELMQRFPIDPDRIYAVGMSRGGDFAVYLAEHRSTTPLPKGKGSWVRAFGNRIGRRVTTGTGALQNLVRNGEYGGARRQSPF